MENKAKRVMAIDGYSVELPAVGLYTVLAESFGNVVEFEDLYPCQMSMLVSAFEADANITSFVVANHNGPFVLD